MDRWILLSNGFATLLVEFSQRFGELCFALILENIISNKMRGNVAYWKCTHKLTVIYLPLPKDMELKIVMDLKSLV